MIKEIKHQFMAFRNGIVADSLRHAGYPHSIIFGLQLPQIGEIARGIQPEMSFADELWQDENVRESRLLACYLFPQEEITADKAVSLALSVNTQEEADILTFRLLRKLPFAEELRKALSGKDMSSPVLKALERFDL
ncbi:MAG: DNA alkylation repair protein [Muribaculaceae bacterium]|nr:DNA alkylation repair protein [Muribaculaceae bacterium]